MATFTGSSLFLLSVEQYNTDTVKVRFSQIPLAANPAGANDALNPSNYTLSGPSANSVLSVGAIAADTQGFLLNLNSPLTDGTWTLTVQNIQTAIADPLVAPTSLQFEASAITPQTSVAQGATSDSAKDTLRKHLPPAIAGPGVDALLTAIGTGDEFLKELAQLAFNQLFVSSASGKYLDRKGSNLGLTRPENVGLNDENFRKLIVSLTNEKVTLHSLLQILEIFYGKDATRAHMETTVSQPYDISADDELFIEVDGQLINVVFQQNDFQTAGAGTAQEVAAALNRYFELQKSTAFAIDFTDPITNTNFVKVYSGSIGLNGKIRVLGGRAQQALLFPTPIATTQVVGTQWKVETFSDVASPPDPSLVADRVRITWIGGANPSLQLVNVGDYVTIYGGVFNSANRGSFNVVDVTTTYFEIEHVSGFGQPTVTQTANDDLLFFRPDVYTLNNQSRFSSAIQAEPNLVDVILSATTQAVNREPFEAAYLHAPTGLEMKNRLEVTSLSRAANVISITTAEDHDLVVGDIVYLYPAENTAAAAIGILNQSYTVATTPTTDSLTINSVGANVGAGNVTYPQYIYPCFRDTAGLVRIKTTAAHGLQTGDHVFIENLMADVVRQVESYDDVPTGSLSGALQNYTLTKLEDGTVLMCGGDVGGVKTAVVRKFDPSTGSWAAMTSMAVARSNHTATLMAGNRVLVAGGDTGAPGQTAEIYDVETNAWVSTANTTATYEQHFATLLEDGRVLVGGGSSATVEIYNPVTTAWSTASSLPGIRTEATATRLNDGMVLVVGGLDGGGAMDDTRLYNPYINVWYTLPVLTVGRYAHKAFLLTPNSVDGKVYIIGGTVGGGVGTSTVEVYTPSTRSWSTSVAPLPNEVWNFAGDNLNSNKIIMGGGLDGGGTPSQFVWVYDALLNTWEIQQLISTGILNNALVVLDNGDVLFGPSETNARESFIRKYQNGSLSIGNVNGVQKVTAVNSTVFTFDTSSLNENLCWTPLKSNYVDHNNDSVIAYAYPMASAQDVNHIGPYVFEINDSLSITSVATTLNQDILRGQTYDVLTVTDTTGFNTNGGYLTISFGYNNQSGPIKYSRVSSSTEIILQIDTVFDQDISTGASVIDLNGRTPFVPEGLVGGFYLVDSIAGRIEASKTIDRAKAAGVKINKTILYPDDIGLGNERQPESGSPKISDKVYIWGSQEDVDNNRNS